MRYIIVGPARSGTTVTHLCLAGHPNVSALSDEVQVHPFFTEGISAFTHGNDAPYEKEKGYLALFDALCSLNQPKEMLACGLKTALTNKERAATFVQSVQANFPEAQIIFTLREDIVAQFGSLKRAAATGNWHSWVQPKQKLSGKIYLDRTSLYRHAIDYLRIEKTLLGLKQTHEVHLISYEKDILPGIERLSQLLFDCLHLPQVEPSWLHSRKVAPPPEQYIADYRSHAEFVRQLRLEFEAAPDVAQEAADPNKKGMVLRKLRGWFPF